MTKKENEEKVQILTPEQYLHARLNSIDEKIEKLLSIAQEENEEEED